MPHEPKTNAPPPDLFASQMAVGANQELEPLFVLEVDGRLPSWNEILGMEHWARDKFKCQLQDAFLSALRVCARDCSTKTTSAKNIMSIAADTLDSYREMVRARRKSRRDRKRLNQKAASLFESKSSELMKPPF